MMNKILLTFFLVLVHTIVSAQTKTYSGASGNWNVATNWTPSGVPVPTDDVVIPSGRTVNISSNSLARTVSVSGTLSMGTGIRLTVSGSFIVNSGGTFSMGSGSDSSTLLVYGNYTNNGTTNFFKSDVVIAGDLLSPATSGLQNQGNVIVGGNIIGAFNLTGGTGTNQIYAVNPIAIVTITPTSIDDNVAPGVFPSGEDTDLITLVNLVIYGGSCSFTVNDIASVPACPGANVVFSVATTATAPNYLWQVNTSGSGWVDLTNGPTYSGVNSSTLTIRGVTVGMNNYRYRARITSGSPSCVKNGNYGVLTINTGSTTWNGSAWSNGIPVGGSSIIFTGTYPPAVDPNVNLFGCSCLVSGNAVVTIRSGRTLTVVNEVNVAASAALIFENNASLVQTNDAALNSGNIQYKRQTNIINKFDYTYWSSPVFNQRLLDVSPNTLFDKFFSFDASTDTWRQENTANLMEVGRGYIIRGPQFFPGPFPSFGIHQATFTGRPNNGVIGIPIPYMSSETSNLIGNPYPSAIDADLFLAANNLILDGTLYFWTQNSPPSNAIPGDAVFNYTSNDYASYNGVGGTATLPAYLGGVVPSGKIAAGQAFFATGIAAGTAVFNNGMRVSGGATGQNNSQFFKINNTKTKGTNSVEKHRIWLNLTNTQGAFKQMLVGYVANATNGFDKAYDGQSFDGNEFLDFYSINDDKNLTIQGRSLPFDKNDEVALGYSSTIEGAFSISIDQTDGILGSEDVFIEDKTTNTIKNLKEGAYNFSTKAGSFNDRFVLRYKDKTLGTDDFDKTENQVLISKNKNELKIKSELESLKRITVFDLLGRKVFDKEGINSNEFSISNSTFNKQILIVKVMLTNGKVISKKVF